MLVRPWLETIRRQSGSQRRRKARGSGGWTVVEALEDRTLLTGGEILALAGGFSADASIKAGNANNNYGDADDVDMDGSPDEAALVRFDVSAIPVGSTVISVSMTVNVTNDSDDAYRIYELLRPWAESEVTFNSAADGDAWQTEGVLGSSDRGDVVLGTIGPTSKGTVTVDLSAAGIAVVQGWVDVSGNNNGLIFQGYSGNSDKLSFSSIDEPNSNDRPTFEVIYETPSNVENTPPVVDAGSDLTVIVTSVAVLDGSIADDGLPVPPGSVSGTWTVVSGPGSVTFGDESAVVTTAAFSEIGTYVVRLTADDGELTASSDTTITVVDQQPPEKEENGAFPKSGVAEVFATEETDPLNDGGDAADDPSIWVHPTDPSLSLIIATDKTSGGGLIVYDLGGNELSFIEAGQHNNVDVRYGFVLGSELVDLVSASNRSTDEVDFYRVDADARTLIYVGSIESEISVYGYGMYHSRQTGKYYGFVNSKDGEVEQWEILDAGNGKVTGVKVREFDVGGQTEGIAADDELGFVYIGEENEGIWKYGAEPDAGTGRTSVDTTGSGGQLTDDVEGLAIYYRRDGKGYLIASRQGSDDFTVYRREGDNEYLGTFEIEDGAIDRVTGTDGIAVTNMSLGSGPYANGLFVAHDGNNDDGNQNYKLVAWDDIADDGVLGLAIDTAGYNVRGNSSLPGTNQPPAVDAGSGQTILIGGSATLDGTVTDDGLPAPPGTVTTAWSMVSGPGTVAFADASSVDTTATFSLAGTYVLRLSADDGEQASEDEITVTVDLQGNSSPASADDSYTVDPGATLTIDDAGGSNGDPSDDGLLVNDIDADGDPLIAVLVSSPAHGALALNADGTFNYTHDGSNNFSDSFSYRAHDGTAFGNTATVNITINSNNEPPQAAAESYTVIRGDTLTADDAAGTAGDSRDDGVLANDTDADGDPLIALLVSGPAHGTLTLAADGTFVYTHDGSNNFSDSFAYRANDGIADSNVVTASIDVLPTAAEPYLRTGIVTGVGNTSWRTVTLDRSYESMVVVLAANYDVTSVSLSTRVRNAAGNSFELKVDRTDGSSAPVAPVDVHYLVVEEGIYNAQEHGVTMEALKFTSSITDRFDSWVGDSRFYVNDYTSPAVLGQVMSYNDASFSAFWSRGADPTEAPSAESFYAGKHVGQDPDSSRADETIGYIVIEAGSGNFSGRNYVAGVGPASVRGVAGDIAYTYNFGNLSNAATAIVTQTGMKGFEGGWAVLYDDDPLTPTSVNLAIDEDQAGDSERNHTAEQVAYLVFANTRPAVNAGPDQTIVLGEQADLDATVGDDGLPAQPGSVTVSWSVVVGNGSVTFGDSSAVDTTASFNAAGTYVLQLTANDGELTAFDQITVTVNQEAINEAPQLDAGVDQTVLITDAATLDGTLTDDGLPNPPGTVTPRWSLLSGPGTVTFADEFQVDTTATFSDIGTYVLRLTAFDGALTALDTVTITVADPSANQAPQVDAGADLTILSAGVANLNGSAGDDGLPDPPNSITTQWSLLTGPGTATFANPSDVDTAVTFSDPGSYVLQLSAFDGDLTSTDIVTVTVIELSEVVTVSFQDGVSPEGTYSGTRDAQIRDRTPAKNYGDTELNKLDGEPDEAGLILWDVSSIPAGSLVVSATITLSVVNESDDTYEIYELLRPWIESEVTFNEYAGGLAWEIAGVAGGSDRGSTVLGTLSAPTEGLVTIELNAAGIAVVQSWVDDPTRNFGIILQDYDGATDRLQFELREAISVSNRPKLTLTYDTSGIAGSNVPPQVDAGLDQTVFVTETAILDAAVSDDGLPVPVSQLATNWSVISGPGNVTFADSATIDTTAAFSDVGTYVLRLTANDTDFTAFDEVTITVNSLQQSSGIWLSVDELMSLPTSGTAWDFVASAAAEPIGTPNISDQDDTTDTQVLAKALVGVRTGNQQYLDEVRSMILAAINTEDGGRTLALARNLVSYIIVADLVGLQPADDLAFRAWLVETLTEDLQGRTLQTTHEDRPNNWGTNAGASRAALAWYLGDEQEIARTADVFKGWLGDRSSYTGFTFDGDLSWHADEQAPVGINPQGATKDGYSIDGILPDDIQRGGPFGFPATETIYPWEGLQGAIVQAEILYRAGFDVYEWEDRALLRAVESLYGMGWIPDGQDDAWIPFIVDARYGTNFASDLEAIPGKNMGWTAWTHQSGVPPAGNQAPAAFAGPDHTLFVWESADLFGMFTDDGWPATFDDIVTTWSVLSGPGNVAFSDAASRETTASFDTPGTYVLRFTADDTELSGFDAITVTVNDQPPNQPPAVDAGSDRSIFSIETVNLDGTVTDDGWPYPFSPLVTTWGAVSGPGTVTFGDATSIDTTAAFSTAGTYVLELTADDSQQSTSDQVTIIVSDPPQNTAPFVDAGSDQTVLIFETAILDGIVGDDGWPQPPGSTTTLWTVVSGPGSVTFANAAAVDTTASFSELGTYVLRLTADDGELTTFDEATVTVADATTEITLDFQDGVSDGGAYAGTTDTKLSGSSPNNNYGSNDELEIDGSPDRATLIRWELGSVSPGTTVLSASITLNVTNKSDDTYEIYQLLKPWIEGEATWNEATDGVDWEIEGADGPTDRGSTVLGVLDAPPEEVVTIDLNAAGIAVVQSWIDDPQSNFGVIFQDYVDASNGADADSREVTTATNRPKLTITLQTSGSSSLVLDGETASGRYGWPVQPSLSSASVHTGGQAASATPSLDQEQLAPLADDARTVWRSALGSESPNTPDSVTFVIADLPGNLLGQTFGTTVLIDSDAAGLGWFVDATPGDSLEFSRFADNNELKAVNGGPADGRVDLKTVLLHELGHVLGFEHDKVHGIMDDMLSVGSRDLFDVDAGHVDDGHTAKLMSIDEFFRKFAMP